MHLLCSAPFSTAYKLLPILTPLRLSLFSCTSKALDLQALCFDDVATVGGVGTLVRSVPSIQFITMRRP